MDLQSRFVSAFKHLEKMSLVDKEMITKSSKGNKGNLHSKLIYCFIKSIENDSIIAVPEIKIPFKVPLNPSNFGITGRKQWQYKTDVAIYDENKLKGICEVFSMDMIGNYLPLKERDKIYPLGKFTSADKIIHLFNNNNMKNINHKIDFYIVSVLPEKVIQIPSYPDTKAIIGNTDNLFKKFNPQIDVLFSYIRKDAKSCTKIVVSENGIYYNNLFKKI